MKSVFSLDQRAHAPKSHAFAEIWQGISEATQNDVLRLAQECAPGHADLSQLPDALEAWQLLLVDGRYPFELLKIRLCII